VLCLGKTPHFTAYMAENVECWFHPADRGGRKRRKGARIARKRARGR
jgi:hypothetical protein